MSPVRKEFIHDAHCNCSQHDDVVLKRKDVQKVLTYLLWDEEKHYAELGKPRRHIFRTLRKIQQDMEIQ